jgi:hypothetical protein
MVDDFSNGRSPYVSPSKLPGLRNFRDVYGIQSNIYLVKWRLGKHYILFLLLLLLLATLLEYNRILCAAST